MRKRFLSILLVLCIMLTLVPAEAQAAVAVTFSEPKVTSLSVTYDGGESIELLGYQPTISMPAGSKPIFTVTFDNTEQLNAVYITSTKDSDTKYLEAKLQGSKYVTDGYCDPDNHGYVPGTIAVTFSKKTAVVTENQTIDGVDLDELIKALKEQGISWLNETIGDGSKEAEIIIRMGNQ